MGDIKVYWQDTELKFDVSKEQLALVAGEKIISQKDQIEDSKGNPGYSGAMQVTNLRCIWYQLPESNINLSLGYDCMMQIELRVNKLKKNSRFEFIFQSQEDDTKTLYKMLKVAFQEQQQSKLYREIKARGCISQNKNLILLDSEKVISNYLNILSISSDNSQISGKLYLTNIRLVWLSLQNEQFNISIPWICIKSIKKKDLKAGTSVIVETKSYSGGYIVGYKGGDIDKIAIDCQKILQIYTSNPILTSDTIDYQNLSMNQIQQPQFNEDIEIIETGYNQISSSSNQYKMNGDNIDQQNQIIFTSYLGLAIEKPPIGTSIEDLWKIINIK